MTNLAQLRQTIARLENRPFIAKGDGHQTAFNLGEPLIDQHIGPLRRAALHEISTTPQSFIAASSFMCGLLKRAMLGPKPILWLEQHQTTQEYGALYPFGLELFGLDVAHFIVIQTASGQELLKAAYDGLSTQGIGGVILNFTQKTPMLNFTATRKLQLASQKAKIPTVLLYLTKNRLNHSAALTRWHVETTPSIATSIKSPGQPCFSVKLLRNRLGAGGCWFMKWDNHAYKFAKQTQYSTALPRHSLSHAGDRMFKRNA